jgi:putative ABC transport system permease protein
MQSFLQDLRYGLRLIGKNPSFAAVTAAVLALGIGANTAIFSVVNAVLFKSLLFPQAERIVSVPHTPPQDIFPGRKTFSVSPANYYDWKAQNDVFEHMTIYTDGLVSVTGLGDPESMSAGIVSSEFFSVLGARPLLGRLFAEGDDEPGHRVTVLSEGLWRTRFGANPAAVGGAIVLDGQSYTIIGVLPTRLTYPADTQLWIPIVFTAEQRAIRGIHDFLVLARLKPGVRVETAQAQMNAISARLAAQYPADDKGWGAAVIPLHEAMVGDVRPALLVLLGAVGFVLLIACANVANLVLARTLGRRKEIAVRTALGASRARIVRQLFVETILLSLAGGALGVFAARFVVKLLAAAVGDQMPRVSEIRVDGPVLLFALGISLVTGALAGALPAWRLTRADPNEALKQGGRADADAGSPAIRNALVVAEVALALMLMIGAGLLVRSLARLRSVDPGFDPGRTLTALVAIPDTKYATPESQGLFHQQVLERVRALPGVEAAGGISTLPLTDGGSTQPIAIEGRPAARMSEQPEVAVRIVTPGTFKALRVRLVAGRDFTDADTDKSPGAVLISEAMARQFWPGESALGKRLEMTFAPGVMREVVGIVADVKLRGLAYREPIAALYVPMNQLPRGWTYLLVRTSPDPRSLVRPLQAAVRAVDPEQPLVGIQTMEEHLHESLAHARFNMLLLAAFAGLALVLSAVGIYSVLAYSVRRRTREIGIRMALGATARDVLRHVVVQGMQPALVGLAIGLAGAFALGRTLSSLVFGIPATDPATFASVAGLLGLVALAACALPAWRATRVQPTEALAES